MTTVAKAIVVAALQLAIVCSLGAKLLYDRHTCPQAWFRAEKFDPDLPIRGRYASLQLKLNDSRTPEELATKFSNELRTIEQQHVKYNLPLSSDFGRECGAIVVQHGLPTPIFDNGQAFDCNDLMFVRSRNGDDFKLRIAESVPFFIPDTAEDPTRIPKGDELWVLATVPRKGPPRAIAVGIKRAGEEQIQPLGLR